MKRTIILLILVCWILFGTVLTSSAAPLLNWIDKNESVLQTKLDIYCTEVPVHKLKFNGQRIDLFLQGADGKDFSGGLPEDGRVVRILMAQKKTGILLSIVLQAQPSSVNVLTDNRLKKVTLEINWSKSHNIARPEMKFGNPGRSKLTADRGASLITDKSKYANDWLRFFKEYEKDWSPRPPLQFSLVDLPALCFPDETMKTMPEDFVKAIGLFQQGQWSRALVLLDKVSGDKLLNEDAAKPYYLLRGEALLRCGHWDAATEALDKFQELSDSPVLKARAGFLEQLALASSGKFYEVLGQLAPDPDLSETRRTFTFHRCLLLAELYLVTNQPKQAEEVLEKLSIRFPGRLKSIVNLRRADADALLGKSAVAIKQYESLDDNQALMRCHPFSQALYAKCLHAEHKYLAAARRYIELAGSMNDHALVGMALYASAHCEWRRNQGDDVVCRLQDIQKEFAGEEAATRATAKLLDIDVIKGDSVAMLDAAGQYGAVAEVAKERSLREEASFKQALVAYFLNELEESHADLQGFLRENSSGSLVIEAQTLEGQILPRLLDIYLKGGDYLKATVLVEQCRDILVAQGVSSSVLIDTAEAFRSFGLLDRAEKIYLFLLDSFRGQAEEEHIYAPLIQVLLEKGAYSEVTGFAESFIDKYPTSKDFPRIYLDRVKALNRKPDMDMLVKVLTGMKTQISPTLDEYAGKFFQQRGDLENAEKFLLRAIDGRKIDDVDPAIIAVTAEVLFDRGQYRKALALYEQLIKKKKFFDQSLYRCAQIYRLSGRQDKSINLLQQLSEKGTDGQWKTMACELLGMENALKN